MTMLVMIGLVVFGIVAYRSLPISDLPTVDYPTVTVSASLPGASPETMASAVATPLEKQFSTISGIDNMTSTSSTGSTQITLQFSLDRSVDAAAQDVNAAISKTLRQLPPDIQPPSYQKVNPAASPILFYALTSSTMSLPALDDIGEGTIAQHLSTIEGVAAVQVFGSQKYAVRIQLDPTALAYRKITLDAVASAVAAGNANRPTGVLQGRSTSFTVQANGQLTSAAEFRNLSVTYRNGAAVPLGTLGRVFDDVQNNQTASWFDGTRAIVLAVQRQPGSNTVAVAKRVRATLDSLATQVPGDVRVQLLFDRSQGIQESVSDVKHTLVLTLVLVVLVIFVFLRNVWATVIPSLALPMSILGTFAVMSLLGYSLDNLSLMALTLAVGFVVDDAVVMLENIVRHLEMDKPPFRAAIDGAREVGFTILSMTLSLTAVFIPLIFLGGVVGRLFREFAVTIAIAILMSGLISITLTPMLSSLFLRHESEKHGRLYQLTERGYDWLLHHYQWTLDWAMRRRRLVLAFSALVLVGTYAVYKQVPTGFIPSEDTGQLSANTVAAQGTSFAEMVRHQQQVAAIVARDTNVAHFMSSVGGGGGLGSANEGRVMMSLKPRGERLSAEQIVAELRPKLSRTPGVQVFMQLPPAIQIGGRTSRSQYQFSMQSSDLSTLYPAAQKLVDEAQQLSQLTDVTSDLQLSNPQVDVRIDRARAAALGITADAIESALYDAYGSRQVSTIFGQNDQYWVIMELLPQYQRDVSALRQLYVPSSNGTLVALGTIATLSRAAGPSSVSHAGQLPSVTMSFNLRDGVALSEGTAAVQQLAARTLPAGITTSFSGTAQAFQSTQAGLLMLIVLAVFVIYVILGVLYESFVHPITILSGLPFAAFGALVALWITRQELSVYAMVGIILLIGIVKKNAIMMIDFALEAERQEHLEPAAAIVKAAHVRFRPIMMTTVAALVGTLPIALGIGAGAESRRPLGLAVVGGLAFS
ncbi:MAG: efflux RND transporter permease subunit, partial [Gemmatirosa sp.]|nr:efflux RND transporter permease subunit [Gemmatirosa sp.]